MWYLSFCAWIIFHILFSIPIHFSVHKRRSCFLWLNNIPLCKYSISSLSPSFHDEYLGLLHLFANVTTSSEKSVGVSLIWWFYILGKYFQYVAPANLKLVCKNHSGFELLSHTTAGIKGALPTGLPILKLCDFKIYLIDSLRISYDLWSYSLLLLSLTSLLAQLF